MNPEENKNEILKLFKQGPAILENALEGLSDSELDYSPSNGGWTIREIVHHIVDGDDLWKIGIKMALGSEEAEFSLKWYGAFPQMEWAKRWNYEKRSIEISINFLKAIREHILQLLENVSDGWNKTVRFRNPDGEIKPLQVGTVIKMQANHVVHHIKRISEIRKEISGK